MTVSRNSKKPDPRVERIFIGVKDRNNINIIHLLSEVGLDSYDSHLRTSLIWATFYNNLDLLKWLIANGADINHQDNVGYTALHFAGQEKKLESAQLLLDKGASLEIADMHGNTPIWTAIFNSKGDYSLVKLYVSKGANLDIENKHNMTPRKLANKIAGFDLNSIIQHDK
jgi:ankyrin repeat protein